ncbi:putative wall-associated receptor kinase-like 16 [Miscanthus floridulus]|uniref:putative wall-associated receptor kinase-like 16 n=1 Tax=Miscanthus floridulus TaxID=154761 RepID=UPI00345AE00E
MGDESPGALLRPLLAAAVVAMVSLQLLVPHGVAGAATSIGLPGCRTTCGNVSVPYPFGIEPSCYLKGFDLVCNTSYTPPQLFLPNIEIHPPIRHISLDDSMLTAKLSYDDHNSTTSDDEGIYFFDLQASVRWKLVSRVLQWPPNETRAGNATCPKDLGTTACHSTHSTCQVINTSGSTITGYTCRCDDGYQGNAYLRDGCIDIDECALPGKCFGICTNFPGKYLCECPKGTTGNPYRNVCVKPNTGLIIGLGVGSGAILLFVVLSTIFVIHRIMTRNKRMRQRFFKQNRGQLLQQLVCQRADISERMILTLEELEKATNNFDKARELGGGGHGIVYKGILSTLHVVAIKKAKIVIQREIDDFINELVILSQINHRNIVKLHGCCLETEVPLLVYEFISNGTLYNHLHVEALVSLSWKDRVRIAVEAARALAYLHSLTSMPIIHRDVKSPNILLNDNLTMKLSDFGASRYIPIDQTGLDTTVQGTFGYLDPTYHSTGHLTEKSDVYSFGVILIELLTRKKPVSYRSSNGYGLVRHFTTLLSEHNLVDILDPQVVREGAGEVIDISLLAAMCVKFVSKDRPTMRQVEMTLESIHAVKEYALSDMTDESEENYDQVNNMRIEGINNDTGIHDGLRELSEIIIDESNDGTTLVANISQKCG